MPDYMYLLESRMSPEQRAVLLRVQELARAQDCNIYLTGGAVRDLISGMPLRDLDFTVEGNPARMARELEKGGAKVVVEDDHLRHYELIFSGDVDGSLSAARDDYYARPGAKPEMRWSTVMEDLRRRDFSINAVAISLNQASRGLLLDPTNGLADLERREVRSLSIHAFTNQPVRLLRALRYCARMGSKMEQRTEEWFDLAMERKLPETIEGREAGNEFLAAAREENVIGVLKLWESRGLLGFIHPKLQRRRPDYDGLGRLARARENFQSGGVRMRQMIPAAYYILARLKSREAAASLRSMEVSSQVADRIESLPEEGKKLLKLLRGRKTKQPRDAYRALSEAPTEMLAFVDAEFRNATVGSKIRNYLNKWRPMRLNLPTAELDGLGVTRGPKFDKILEQLFEMQLRGRGRTPEDVTKLLKQFAGIKEERPKKTKEDKKQKVKLARPPKEKEPAHSHEQSSEAQGSAEGSSGTHKGTAKPSRVVSKNKAAATSGGKRKAGKVRKASPPSKKRKRR